MPLVNDDYPSQDGILKSTSSANAPVPVKSIKITTPAYKPNVIDTRETGYQNMQSYVEGSPWNVNYYSQILTSDTQVGGHQPSQDPAYQPKNLIENFELRVTSPLATSQDADDNEMHLRGSANVFPVIIPNIGDMFVAEIGDGRRGAFRVTVSSKMSIMARAGYQIEYELVNDAPDYLSSLNESVVKTSVFNRDFMRFGQNPIVVKERYDLLLQAEEVLQTTIAQYFSNFFSREYQTIILPHQSTIVYDPFLVDFLLSSWSTHDAHEIRSIRKLGVHDDPSYRAKSLWHALAQRDASVLNMAFKRSALLGIEMFYAHPGNDGIRYSGINHVVCPLEPKLNADMSQTYARGVAGIGLVPSPEDVVGSFVTQVYGRGVKELTPSIADSIVPVTTDHYYVLSEEFYTDGNAKTVLEVLVWQFLRGEAMDLERLTQMAKQHCRWGILEQFYYVPIVLHLLRTARYTA